MILLVVAGLCLIAALYAATEARSRNPGKEGFFLEDNKNDDKPTNYVDMPPEMLVDFILFTDRMSGPQQGVIVQQFMGSILAEIENAQIDRNAARVASLEMALKLLEEKGFRAQAVDYSKTNLGDGGTLLNPVGRLVAGNDCTVTVLNTMDNGRLEGAATSTFAFKRYLGLEAHPHAPRGSGKCVIKDDGWGLVNPRTCRLTRAGISDPKFRNPLASAKFVSGYSAEPELVNDSYKCVVQFASDGSITDRDYVLYDQQLRAAAATRGVPAVQELQEQLNAARRQAENERARSDTLQARLDHASRVAGASVLAGQIMGGGGGGRGTPSSPAALAAAAAAATTEPGVLVRPIIEATSSVSGFENGLTAAECVNAGLNGLEPCSTKTSLRFAALPVPGSARPTVQLKRMNTHMNECLEEVRTEVPKPPPVFKPTLAPVSVIPDTKQTTQTASSFQTDAEGALPSLPEYKTEVKLMPCALDRSGQRWSLVMPAGKAGGSPGAWRSELPSLSSSRLDTYKECRALKLSPTSGGFVIDETSEPARCASNFVFDSETREERLPAAVRDPTASFAPAAAQAGPGVHVLMTGGRTAAMPRTTLRIEHAYDGTLYEAAINVNLDIVVTRNGRFHAQIVLPVLRDSTARAQDVMLAVNVSEGKLQLRDYADNAGSLSVSRVYREAPLSRPAFQEGQCQAVVQPAADTSTRTKQFQKCFQDASYGVALRDNGTLGVYQLAHFTVDPAARLPSNRRSPSQVINRLLWESGAW